MTHDLVPNLHSVVADTKRQVFLYGPFVIEESNEGWECSLDGQAVTGSTYETPFEAIASADEWLEAKADAELEASIARASA